MAALDVGSWPVLAIGDAANDLPMFAVATLAVAVANADAAVLDAGVRQTAGSFGSGVAEALRVHLPALGEPGLRARVVRPTSAPWPDRRRS